MTPEEVKHVFEPFNQAKTKANKGLNHLGNGIGLSICKQICENLGGGIFVTSKLGYGTTFTFQMKVFKTQGGHEIVPDAVMPDAVMPDAVMPDAVMPDVVMPDAVIMDVEAKEREVELDAFMNLSI